ncbi:MAG TPA: patatin-like phospholipase family protein [Egibacteraceae bacterium]|nr:patatin-like phospholipase family protein [Egibacteraceae bacterium]
MTESAPQARSRVAFVLGGGGVLGAAEVGMLRALGEAGIAPDVVLGTSVGALNGAVLAAEPETAVERLIALWGGMEADNPFGGSLLERVTTFARTRTHLHRAEPLRAMLEETISARRFEDLALPFQCVAASIEGARARWFSSGPLIDAVLASAAVPGLLPPVEIDGEHFLDGGLVHSIPVGRAVDLGARVIYVLQVGRIEHELEVPTKPWEVALVAFEIARRHRFVEEMSRLPDSIEVHVLPTGSVEAPRYTDPRSLRYRSVAQVKARIESAHEASAAYLARREAD